MPDSSTLVIWMIWGGQSRKQLTESVASVAPIDCETCVITDTAAASLGDLSAIFDHVVVAEFQANDHGHKRKSELLRWTPPGYTQYLFLDLDTRVIGDISLGFEKARQFGVAMAPAAHYCLDQFWGFDKVMRAVDVDTRGQLLYNSGVIFFTRTPDVEKVFTLWENLASRFDHSFDQAYLTLAMEMLDFRPYALSPNYNYRGMGVPIIGQVRIWHSRFPVPDEINNEPDWWPMRYFRSGRFYRPKFTRRMFRRSMNRIIGRK